jgi:ClpA/ClpB-like protein
VERRETIDMFKNFTDRANKAIALAKLEAGQFQHHYVGTEHILLGLLEEGSGDAAGVLTTFGVDATQLRAEIERFIQRGAERVSTTDLPLTPRAKTAIEFAAAEARSANQALVDSGHLLLGLIRQEDGLAGQLLLNLGLRLQFLREEVLKTRHAQMKLVERAVRPVRASQPRKRKMREELLAHLTAIYEEEQARLGNPTAALKAASERFGDPATLASELNSALPFAERANYFINRNLGWRPPESAARYMMRFATGMTAFVAVFFCLILAAVLLKDGWRTTLILARPLVGGLPFLFIDTWILGMLYIKLRDAICGALWARKSLSLAFVWGALIALVAFGTAVGFNAVANLDANAAARAVYISMAVAAVAAIVFPIVAHVSGPEEIGDVVWASLNLDDATPEIAS